MLVKVLKPFSCAVDSHGLHAEKLEKGHDYHIKDDLIPGLVAAGLVEVIVVKRAEQTASVAPAKEPPAEDITALATTRRPLRRNART